MQVLSHLVLRLACCLILCLGSVSAVADPVKTIKIRVTDYPPQYFQDSSGRWTGLDVELGRALVERAGLRPAFVAMPWARALVEMKEGDLQLMMNLSRTPERSEFMHWIGPERCAQMALVVRRENEGLPVKDLDDLPLVAEQYKLQFGIQRDAHYADAFAQRMNDPYYARHFDTITFSNLNAKKLAAGRILGFFEDKDSMLYQLAHNSDFEELALHSFVLQEEAVYFGISKRGVNAGTLQRLQQAYEELESDGTFAEIRQRKWGKY